MGRNHGSFYSSLSLLVAPSKSLFVHVVNFANAQVDFIFNISTIWCVSVHFSSFSLKVSPILTQALMAVKQGTFPGAFQRGRDMKQEECSNEPFNIDATLSRLKRERYLSRYRYPLPRQRTVDMDGKRAPEIIMKDFHAKYGVKIAKWAQKLCRQYKMPSHLHEDMVQAALLQAWKNIPGWNPQIANMWTYSVLGVRKSMMCIVRQYHSQPPYGTKKITPFVLYTEDVLESAQVKDIETLMEKAALPSIEEAIDLKRVTSWYSRKHPKKGRRLLACALDGGALADLAREEAIPVSRQAYYNSLSKAKRDVARRLESSHV